MAVSFIRAFILYVTIIFCLRIMGKRQISELQTSELVVTLLISNIASIPMQNTEQPLVSGILPILALVSFEIIASVIMMKSGKFRRFLSGRPIIVIDNGNIDQRQMKRLRLSADELSEQLRQLNIFNISDVAFAIVETNGKISVMKKSSQDSPTCSQLSLNIPKEKIDAVVISDGQVSQFGLSLCGLSQDWVNGVLSARNMKIENVFIMTANNNKKFNIIERQHDR